MLSPTWSQACVSSSRPPSTACSASIEWGGVWSRSMPGLFWPSGAGPATDQPAEKLWKTSALLFGFDDHRQVHVDVGVQMQRHHMLAHRAQRAVRQPQLAAGDFVAGGGGGLGNVGGADRAEQLALVASLGADRELEALELRLAGLGALQRIARDLLKLGAALLELLHVVRGGQRRLALGQQEIAGIAGTHLDAIAQVAEVGHFFQKKDVHGNGLSAERCRAAAPGSARA